MFANWSLRSQRLGRFLFYFYFFGKYGWKKDLYKKAELE